MAPKECPLIMKVVAEYNSRLPALDMTKGGSSGFISRNSSSIPLGMHISPAAPLVHLLPPLEASLGENVTLTLFLLPNARDGSGKDNSSEQEGVFHNLDHRHYPSNAARAPTTLDPVTEVLVQQLASSHVTDQTLKDFVKEKEEQLARTSAFVGAANGAVDVPPTERVVMINTNGVDSPDALHRGLDKSTTAGYGEDAANCVGTGNVRHQHFHRRLKNEGGAILGVMRVRVPCVAPWMASGGALTSEGEG